MARRILKYVGFLMLAILLFVPLYVLSYAPFVRFHQSSALPTYTETVYWPVEYLIDETAIGLVYFEWANVCGVKEEMECDSSFRSALKRVVIGPPSKRAIPAEFSGGHITLVPRLPPISPTRDVRSNPDESTSSEEVDESLKILLDP